VRAGALACAGSAIQREWFLTSTATIPPVHYLRTVGWIPCCIYGSVPAFWLIVHPYADLWRQRHRKGKPVYQFLVPLWMAMWVVLYVATWPLRHVFFYPAGWSWIPGLALLAVGTVLYTSAHAGFSFRQLVGFQELRPDQHASELAIAGVRQRVRHPVYLAHLCEMIGFAIGSGRATCWALTAFALATGWIMIRSEESELIARFGQSYREYQQRVPALIPRL
jgi:protein-S-isoprenylcysteine O-methyltransferase Ste14